MNTSNSYLKPAPTLPRPLALPLALIPPVVHSTMLVTAMNRILAPELADGELDFLQEKVMLIRVTDAKISCRITLDEGKLRAASGDRPHDLSIEGTVYDYLLLTTRREDPDTLFFNRRLRLGGSTELGLFVKNFLDSLELDERLGYIQKLLDGATNMLEPKE
jgi:predicted lipid carrier protein YhbT